MRSCSAGPVLIQRSCKPREDSGDNPKKQVERLGDLDVTKKAWYVTL